MTGRYSWRTWAGHGAVWANDPLLIEHGRLTLGSLLKAGGYFTGCVGKWHLGFGRPGTPGWDDMLGLDFNGELKPGPLEVGFSYFYGMPQVGQPPNTLSGSRMSTKLSETPAAITVLTKELMEDIGAKNTTDFLDFATNAGTADLSVDPLDGVLRGFESGECRHGPFQMHKLTLTDAVIESEFRLITATHPCIAEQKLVFGLSAKPAAPKAKKSVRWSSANSKSRPRPDTESTIAC